MKKSGVCEHRFERTLCAAFVFAVVVIGFPGGAAAGRERWPVATHYTVVARSGDTIGTVAERYHVSSSLVARLNGVNTNDRVRAGRRILIPAITRATRDAVLSDALDRSAPNYATRPWPAMAVRSAFAAKRSTYAAPSAISYRTAAKPVSIAAHSRALLFAWPIAGPVISSFGPGSRGTRNDGINIAAELGTPFRASAAGTVSYAGALHGYGNLILIAHEGSYVTTYAHADTIVVTQGETVGKGQVIGTTGTSGGVDRPQLHFEIRRGVTPINPNLLLAAGR